MKFLNDQGKKYTLEDQSMLLSYLGQLKSHIFSEDDGNHALEDFEIPEALAHFRFSIDGKSIEILYILVGWGSDIREDDPNGSKKLARLVSIIDFFIKNEARLDAYSLHNTRKSPLLRAATLLSQNPAVRPALLRILLENRVKPDELGDEAALFQVLSLPNDCHLEEREESVRLLLEYGASFERAIESLVSKQVDPFKHGPQVVRLDSLSNHLMLSQHYVPKTLRMFIPNVEDIESQLATDTELFAFISASDAEESLRSFHPLKESYSIGLKASKYEYEFDSAISITGEIKENLVKKTVSYVITQSFHPLCLCAILGKDTHVNYLLENNDYPPVVLLNAYRAAVFHGRTSIALRLLKHPIVAENAGQNNNEALGWCIDKGYLDIFEALITVPAVQEELIRDARRNNSLLYHTVRIDRFECFKRLMECEAVMTHATGLGNGILWLTAELNRLDMFNYLLGFESVIRTLRSIDGGMFSMLKKVVDQGHQAIANRLFEFPIVFREVEGHRDAAIYLPIIKPFVDMKLQCLAARRQTFAPTNTIPTFDITKEEVPHYFYLLRFLIRKNNAADHGFIEQLIQLPSLAAQLHLPMYSGEANELLRLARQVQNAFAVTALRGLPNISSLDELDLLLDEDDGLSQGFSDGNLEEEGEEIEIPTRLSPSASAGLRRHSFAASNPLQNQTTSASGQVANELRGTPS